MHGLTPLLEEKLRGLPEQPGVYLMRDRWRRVVYIGKAANLRRRVQSYFRKGTLRGADPKLRSLIRGIEDFDFLALRSEEEAILTESRLIKQYRPRYNILWKDDKRFLLLKINLRDPWPRLSACRVRKDDGASYFGPYTHSRAARAAQDFAERRYGLRRCRPLRPGPNDHRHCLADVLRFCSAPCVGRITSQAYLERAREACAFLRGERPGVLKELRKEMLLASQALQFEKAAALRDTLRLLDAAVRRRARAARTPELHAALARQGMQALAESLDLACVPRVIEGFDISNISGTLAVGSMVCAVDGLPRPNRYRSFRVRLREGADDTAMMAEVVRRHYTRAIEERRALPGLVLVDGGLAQVRAVRRVLDDLELNSLPAVGLAKRFEELFRPHDTPGTPLRLPADSPALHVLQRLRDEAHRFALTYHRNLRARRLRESLLDDLEGIGDKRKQLLLRNFGSVSRLRRATERELGLVPGIGPYLARRIFKALRTEQQP